MELLHQLVDTILHLDQHLNDWIALFGSGIYGILFAILFAETGLVVCPFLPGDSLLFALGALAATPNAFLKIPLLAPVLLAAVFLGDNTNYFVGRFLGLKLFTNPRSRICRRDYLDRAHKFYGRHGGKTVVLARFAPILRTFSPFVAGMAEMPYARFLAFSVAGSLLWVGSFLGAGVYFGNLPAVKQNFHLVILAILVISVLPALVEAVKMRREAKAA